MSELHVWGTMTFALGYQSRTVVAARSRAAAARALDVSSAYLRDYGSITGNEAEIEIATSRPGVAFTKDRTTGEFKALS